MLDLPTIETLAPWQWWVIGSIILILEIFAPGMIFVWFALSAFMVGVMSFVIPMALTWQLLLFSIMSVVSLLVGRRYLKSLPMGGDDADRINQGSNRFIGRRATVSTPIMNGLGRIRLNDSDWRAMGPDLPKGAQVEIVDAEGTTLHVLPVDRPRGGER